MGSDSTAKYGADKRKDYFTFKPEDLVIVTDKSHPLYDSEARLKPPSREFVALIKAKGIKTPIQFRYNGEKDGVPIVEVVDGRQRVMAARIINEEEGWVGAAALLVPGILWRGTDSDAADAMIFLNEGRKDDDAWTRAMKAKSLLDRGRTEEQIALVFNRNVATVRNWLRVFDLSDEVQKAIQNEGMSIAAALKLTGKPREEQTAALVEMREAGTLVGAAAVEEAAKQAEKGKKGGKKKKQLRSLKYKEIEAKKQEIMQTKKGRFWDGVVAGMAFAQGEKASKAFEDAPGGD